MDVSNSGERPDKLSKDHEARYRWARQFTEGHAVTEIGCGAGLGTLFLEYDSYLGLEPSEDALIIANRLFKNKKTKFQQYSAFIDRDWFDTIIMFEFAEHIPRQRFEELLDKMKGCQVLASTPASFDGGRCNSPHHVYEYSPQTFVNLFRDRGWKTEAGLVDIDGNIGNAGVSTIVRAYI